MPIGGACSCQEIERMMQDFLADIQSMIGGKRGSGKKRAPSKYNLFIGSCMKEGNSMKECSTKWKEQKKQS